MNSNMLKVKITGLVPLLMHSDRYANPLDPLTKKHKQLTAKRKKTDEDHELILKSEWIGGLYLDAGKVVVPGLCVQGCLNESAKMQKLGSTFKKAITIIEDNIPLKYNGPEDLEALWADESFRDIRSVRVSTSKVMRCRPCFREWSLKFTIAYSPELISDSDIVLALKNAGKFVGLLDFRPRFGRFTVEI